MFDFKKLEVHKKVKKFNKSITGFLRVLAFEIPFYNLNDFFNLLFQFQFPKMIEN